MKLPVAFVLAFIHVIAASTIASELAKDHGWNGFFVLLAWLVGGFLGLFPIIRSVAVLVLVCIALDWHKAIWVGPVTVAVLWFVNLIGTRMLDSLKEKVGVDHGFDEAAVSASPLKGPNLSDYEYLIQGTDSNRVTGATASNRGDNTGT